MLLAEELILLALDDVSGKFSTSATSYGNYAIAGALLMDLYLLGKLNIDGKKIEVIDTEVELDDLLHEVIVELKNAKRPKSLSDWVNSIASYGNYIIKFLIKRLTNQGILGKEEKTVLKIFHTITRPIKQPELKNRLILQIQDILLNNQEPDAHMIELLSLIKIANLIPSLFAKPYRKEATNRIKRIIKSERIGKVVQDLITAIESSAATVTIIAAIS